jgi:ubiquinone/menaquinone biosynthesis C-methylase UbiE
MKSNAEWKAWGEHDPLFAVASWKGKGKNDKSPWTDEEFYRLGEQDWNDFKCRWTAYGLSSQHCLEIGCGAGRITNQLAKDFSKVTAVDVSEDQVAYAKSRLRQENIEFDVTDGVRLPVAERSISAVFSCHVFQHFDSHHDATQVILELFRVMKPGATLCIHLPLCSLPYDAVRPLLKQLHTISKSIGSMRAAFNRARGKLIMRELWYERDWLDSSLRKIGFTDVETRGFRLSSNQDWHDIVLARKSAN